MVQAHAACGPQAAVRPLAVRGRGAQEAAAPMRTAAPHCSLRRALVVLPRPGSVRSTAVRRRANARCRSFAPAATATLPDDAAAERDTLCVTVAAPEEHESPGWRRVVAITAVTLGLCNIDRVLLSIAGVPLAAELGLGLATMGVLQSAYLWGYGIGQARARARARAAGVGALLPHVSLSSSRDEHACGFGPRATLR